MIFACKENRQLTAKIDELERAVKMKSIIVSNLLCLEASYHKQVWELKRENELLYNKLKDVCESIYSVFGKELA